MYNRGVEGYGRSTYGDAFADVYDDWYGTVTDAEATVDLVAELAAASGSRRVLELAVGTGRLAVPMARRGLRVTGVDASAAMLAQLAARDPDGAVERVLGDMVEDLPDGPFGVALIAYNSLFNLESAERQGACFAAVAARLVPGGRFVVEAFVPDERAGPAVTVRSMRAGEVVLSISEHDVEAQRAHGQFVQFVDGERVRLRPWSIRYAPPAELDAMAQAAGFIVADRWTDAHRRPYGDTSSQHLTVYALAR